MSFNHRRSALPFTLFARIRGAFLHTHRALLRTPAIFFTMPLLEHTSRRIGRLPPRCNCRPLSAALAVSAAICDREVFDHETTIVRWPIGGNRVSGVSSPCSCAWQFRGYGFRSVRTWAESWRTLFGPVLVARLPRAGKLRCRLHLHLHYESRAASDRAETY